MLIDIDNWIAKEPNAYDGVPGQYAPITPDPDPIFGHFDTAEERPGFWAKRAMKCEWKEARINSQPHTWQSALPPH